MDRCHARRVSPGRYQVRGRVACPTGCTILNYQTSRSTYKTLGIKLQRNNSSSDKCCPGKLSWWVALLWISAGQATLPNPASMISVRPVVISHGLGQLTPTTSRPTFRDQSSADRRGDRESPDRLANDRRELTTVQNAHSLRCRSAPVARVERH